MNKPKQIGTATESAVVRYLRTAGFPHAERRALRGAKDVGDVAGTPGVCWEIKGGTAAKVASDVQVAAWLDETMTETANAGVSIGILVLSRSGIGEANAGRWWAIMTGHQYEALACGSGWYFGDRGPIRMHLHQACALLTYAGYGTAQPTHKGVPPAILTDYESELELACRTVTCPVCRRPAGQPCYKTGGGKYARMGVAHTGRYRQAARDGLVPAMFGAP